MATQTCGACRATAEEHAATCPNCGQPLVPAADPAAPGWVAAQASGAVTPPPPPPVEPTPSGQWAPPAMATGAVSMPPVAETPKKSALPTIVLLVVIALIAGAAVFIITRDSDPLPDELLGVGRFEGKEAEEFNNMMEDLVGALGGSAAVAIYGEGPVPTYILFVYAEPAELTFDEEWTSFAGGFTGQTGEFQAGSTVDAQIGEDQARCAASGDGSGSVCVWGNGRHYNALLFIGNGDSSAAMDSVKQVHTQLADVTL